MWMMLMSLVLLHMTVSMLPDDDRKIISENLETSAEDQYNLDLLLTTKRLTSNQFKTQDQARVDEDILSNAVLADTRHSFCKKAEEICTEFSKNHPRSCCEPSKYQCKCYRQRKDCHCHLKFWRR